MSKLPNASGMSKYTRDVQYKHVDKGDSIAGWHSRKQHNDEEKAGGEFQPEGMDKHAIEMRDFRAWKTPREEQVRQAFASFDLDGNGSIDRREIKIALKKYWGVDLKKKELDSLMAIYDIDGNGDLDFEVCASC